MHLGRRAVACRPRAAVGPYAHADIWTVGSGILRDIYATCGCSATFISLGIGSESINCNGHTKHLIEPIPLSAHEMGGLTICHQHISVTVLLPIGCIICIQDHRFARDI